MEGLVIRGKERGRQLGFPTANLHPQNRVIPAHGVYATGTLMTASGAEANKYGTRQRLRRQRNFGRDIRNIGRAIFTATQFG